MANKLFKVVATVKDWFTSSQTIYVGNPNEQFKSLEELAAYLDDPHVAACVKSRKAGVLKLNFDILDNQADPQIVEFVKNAIEKIDTYGITSQMLNFPYLGFQPMEIYYTQKDGLYIINDVKAKPAYWFEFDSNESLIFRGRNLSKISAPKYKVTVLRNNPTYTNPYGEALLAKIHFNMQFKRMGLNYYAQYIENYGMPYTHVKCSNEDDMEAAIAVASNLKSNAVGVSTDNITCENIEATSASATNYESFLKFHNDEISKAILGQTLTTQEGSSGSYALGKVQNGVRQDIIDDDKRNVEAAWNEIIYNLVNINFGNVDRCPIVQFKEEFIIDKTRAERDSIIFTNGAFGFKPSKDYLVNNYGFKDTDLEVYVAPQQTNTYFAEDNAQMYTTEGGKRYDLSGFSAIVQDIIGSILQSMENGETYDEMTEKLINSFDGIDDKEAQDYIGTAIALSSYAGRIDGVK